jgi:hypothetical protein
MTRRNRMDDRPLRLVGSPLVEDAYGLRDATEPDDQTDEWKQGWRACREMLGEEWAVWYARGVAARDESPAGGSVVIAFGILALVGFIVGFLLAVVIFA